MVVALYALGRDLLDLPIQRLEIEGSFQRVTRFEIEAAVAPALDQSFVSADLDEIRGLVAELDWVDSVRLQRDWPGTLRISFSEHRAAAQWGESGLLNTRGELFAEDAGQQYRELPRLDGPIGSHRRVATRYLEIRDRLNRAGLTLDVLRMDARGAFSIEFVGGLSVRIGRDDIDGRIDRFFAVAVPALATDLERVQYIDMRYPSGFAVGWRGVDPAVTQLARLNPNG
jgi:cell division protein FtsQ